MKALLNLIRFPFLFLYFVGSSIASAVGLKNNPVAPVLFVIAVSLAVIVGGRTVFSGAKQAEGEETFVSEGLAFIPSTTSNSIIRITTLESALGLFHFRHGRVPKDYQELRRANLIAGLPEPKPGHEFQIEFETPAIIEVPVGTPPPRHPDDPASDSEAPSPNAKL